MFFSSFAFHSRKDPQDHSINIVPKRMIPLSDRIALQGDLMEVDWMSDLKPWDASLRWQGGQQPPHP